MLYCVYNYGSHCKNSLTVSLKSLEFIDDPTIGLTILSCNKTLVLSPLFIELASYGKSSKIENLFIVYFLIEINLLIP